MIICAPPNFMALRASLRFFAFVDPVSKTTLMDLLGN